MLIASIRDKGQCPCPRCKVTKEEVSNVGMPPDMEIRQSRAWKDDEDHQNWVKAAWSLIYQKGYVVNSTHVDDLLKVDSLVLTEASFTVFLLVFTPMIEVFFRMPSPNDYTNSESTSMT